MAFEDKLESFHDYQNVIRDMEVEKKYILHRHIKERLLLMWDIHKLKSHLEDVYLHSYEYNNLENSYFDIIENITDIFKKLDINNPIVIFGAFNYLCKKGYFSFKHRFVYYENVDDCYPLLGVNVMDGKAVCRHMASMLTDVYRFMGYESYNISTVFKESVSRYSGIPMKIYRNEGRRSIGKKILSMFVYPPYNHLVTLVNDKEMGSLLFDPTNNSLFYVSRYKDAKSILDKDITTWCGIEKVFNDNERYDWYNVVVPTKRDMFLYYTYYYYLGINTAKEMIGYFEDFYRKNKNLYVDVVDKKRKLVKEFHRYLIK